MSRKGKIDSGNPISSSNFLKKNRKSILDGGAFHGMPIEVDVVDYKVAIKACNKAKVEGHVECIDKMKELIHALSMCNLPEGSPVIDKRVKDVLITNFNKFQDEILGTKV